MWLVAGKQGDWAHQAPDSRALHDTNPRYDPVNPVTQLPKLVAFLHQIGTYKTFDHLTAATPRPKVSHGQLHGAAALYQPLSEHGGHSGESQRPAPEGARL